MTLTERERTLENIARLRRAELDASSADVATVREDLEAQLGGTVPRSVAARMLDVSHTALNRWIDAGEIAVVLTPGGRREVPIPVLMDLRDRVEAERRAGRRKLRVLEPAIVEARRRAERLRPRVDASKSEPHRAAELRGLAYHRVLAPRLRRPADDEAQRRISRWREEGRIDPRHADTWEEVLAMPVSEIRRAITADDERGRTLRQTSPFAGLLSEPERRKILEMT